MHSIVESCSLETVDERTRAIASACCPADDAGCAEGLPTDSCSFDCGRELAPFIEECAPLVEVLVQDPTVEIDLNELNSHCMELDPESLVMALYHSECVVCGDGAVTATIEECDAGRQNSNQPGAACRTDCRLPCSYRYEADFDAGDIAGWTSNIANLATSTCDGAAILGGHEALGHGAFIERVFDLRDCDHTELRIDMNFFRIDK
eukprot:SAG11_NODE_7579_length_1126_cov_1.177215_2_plen_206_part_00